MKIGVILVWVLLIAPCWGDIVHLKNGSKLEGEVKKTEDGWTVEKDGKISRLQATEVSTIELSPGSGSREGGEQRLASLRRSVEQLADIPLILERYHRFIEQNAGTPAADHAAKDAALWQDRLDRNLVKFGNQWISAEQRVEIQEKSLAAAEQAKGLLTQGRLKEADAEIQSSLAEDPYNPVALYLRGVLLFRQGQLVPARKSFEAINEVLPNHAPTLNNLAVVLWRQRQFIGALNYYEEAMLSGPPTRLILDNAAEAFAALPEEHRDSPVVKRVLQRFQDQDVQLQAEMAEAGMTRWGATWVDEKQMEQIKAAEKEVQDKLAAMEADFNDTKMRIEQIDLSIEANKRSIRDIEASHSRYLRDKDGRRVHIGYPSIYYELERDNKLLAAQREQELQKLEVLKRKAKEIRRQGPAGQFTGVQRLYELEGSPAVAPLRPTSQPSTIETKPETRNPNNESMTKPE